MNYNQAIEYLESLQSTKIELGLERISTACGRLGNPENKFSSIIVAGTNGKGSTCAFLESILRHHGLKVGLYTSPHLIDVRERIQINRELISKEDFVRMVECICHSERSEESHETIRSAHGDNSALTYFEFIAAMAFLYFAEQKVDVAVLEVGLGGRFDATNVATPLVSIITRIDLDHQKYLGNTIGEIAYQKAGVIKKEVPVVTIDQLTEAMDVLRRVADENNSMLHIVSPNEIKWKLGLEGSYQYENAALAVRAAEIFSQNDSRFTIHDLRLAAALIDTKWPGRLEVISEKPLVILDGAHNPNGAKALAKYIRESLRVRLRRTKQSHGSTGDCFAGARNDGEIIIIFGAMADKDIGGVLKNLSGVADRWVLTRPNLERAASCEAIAEQLELIKETKPIEIINDINDAISQTISKMSENSIIIITGSLYMVAEAKAFFNSLTTPI